MSRSEMIQPGVENPMTTVEDVIELKEIARMCQI
jgi:hypothetical protein